MPDDSQHRPHGPTWAPDDSVGARATHQFPGPADPADPVISHGLHVIVSNVGGGVVLDAYTTDVGHPGDLAALLSYLAARLLGSATVPPGRYQIALPNVGAAGRVMWPLLDDVIITDEPMGEDGVYIAWARDAARAGYGMAPRPADVKSAAVHQAPWERAAMRSAPEQDGRDERDEQWVDARAQERHEAAERAANRRHARLVSALDEVTSVLTRIADGLDRARDEAEDRHRTRHEQADQLADGIVDKLDEISGPVEDAVSLAAEEIVDALEIAAPAHRGRRLAAVRERARREAHEASVERRQRELAAARGEGDTADTPAAPEGAPLDR